MDKGLSKAVRLIETLADSGRPRGVTELAVELQLTKSNVHRLLGTLQQHGWVRQQRGGTGGYELTPRLWELGCRVMDRFDVVRFALGAMDTLWRETQETVHLSVLDGLDVLYVHRIESPHHVRAHAAVGHRAPAWTVATGKALLSVLPAGRLAPLHAQFEAGGPALAGRFDALAEELATARRAGDAHYRSDRHDGVHGVAAAVLADDGEPVCGIGVSAPAERMPPARLAACAEQVRQAARDIGHALGRRGAWPAADLPAERPPVGPPYGPPDREAVFAAPAVRATARSVVGVTTTPS